MPGAEDGALRLPDADDGVLRLPAEDRDELVLWRMAFREGLLDPEYDREGGADCLKLGASELTDGELCRRFGV